MTFLSRAVAQLAERRGADPHAPWGDSTPPSNASRGVAGTSVNETTALQVAAVYGSISVIADAVSSLPVDLMSSPHRRTGSLLPPSQLITQPYAEISAQDWWVQFTISLALRGNFFGQIIARDPDLYPTQIRPVHPDHARVRRLSDGTIEYRFNGKIVKPDDVFHVRLLSVAESLVGLNPVEYLRNILGLSRAADLASAAWFQNSAIPGGWIGVAEDLEPDEAKAMKQSWLQMQQGLGQMGLPAVLTGGAEFHGVSITPEDMQFLASRQFDASTISGQIFRVPPHMIGIVDKTTSWGCLPGDSQVFTTSGPRPIEDVNVGDEVWSLGENGMTPAQVTGWQMTGYKPIRSIHTTGRTLRVTSAHHVPIRRYFGLSDGRKHGECGWQDLLVDGKDIRVGDYLMVPHGLDAGEGVREAPNGQKLSVGLMELCGLYIGDGCRAASQRSRVIICHGHDRDADHMGHYKQVIDEELGVRCGTDRRGTQTRFSSQGFAALIDETGLSGLALTKRVPGWVFGLTRDLQLAFLRGYLDADGSVQRGRIIYSSANKALLEDVRHLCIQLGIPTGRVCLGRLGGTMTIRGRDHTAGPKYQLSLSSLPFNSRIGSNSPHKASAFCDSPHQRISRYDDDWLGLVNRRPQDRRQAPGYEWPYRDMVLQRVTRIEESTLRQPVYDIEVAGNATFIADGVLVSNTGIEQQELGFVRNTLIGYLSRGERALTAVHPPGQFVKFDVSERLRGDRLQRAQANSLEIASGYLLPDEARASEDRPPLPDGIGQTAMAPINAQSLKQMAEASITAAQQKQPVPGRDDSADPGNTGGK